MRRKGKEINRKGERKGGRNGRRRSIKKTAEEYSLSKLLGSGQVPRDLQCTAPSSVFKDEHTEGQSVMKSAIQLEQSIFS